MKKYFVLLYLLCSASAFAQFKLSGKINHYSGKETLKINIPKVYGYYEQNAINIPIAKNGTFIITLPVNTAKFGDLIFQTNFHLLLLDPGKSLKVELNEGDKSIKVLSGTASPANSLLQTVNVEEYPFFLQTEQFYIKSDLATMNTRIVKPYFAMRDKKIALVNQASINPKDKKLIAAELKYAAYNNIYELAELGGENQANVDKLIAGVFNKADIKTDTFPAGPQYYTFINSYLIWKEKTTGAKPDKWVSANKYLPDAVTEQLVYQYILRSVYANDKLQADALTKSYLKKFPDSARKADIDKKTNKLK
ncbi:hypothetical protein [Mucilaginibacter sp. UYCu711]|uniref:hypothetical protein n=1 Tax=Mucilaginibacter sp. UYCu711 TaxID=3156339 RepID=UPI003D227A39